MRAPSWRRYLRFWRSDVTRDVDDELRFHMESRIAEFIAAGMTPQEARAEATKRFGDVDRVRQRVEVIDKEFDHERRRAEMWESLQQDLRYALRGIRRSPAFAIVAILTLALGIGANSAIFSVINGVLLRPLPYREPERLVRLFTSFRGGDGRYAMSQPEFMDYKGLTNSFENAAAFAGAGLTLTGTGEPQRVRGIAATRDFFPVLGVIPARGRNFENDEGRQGTEPVVILSHDFWQNRLGGNPALLGSSLMFNGISRRVIGILPPDVTLERAEAFIPMFINPDSLTSRTSNSLRGVARLKPGVTIPDAQRELNALTRRSVELYPRAYPASMGYGAAVVSMHEVVIGDVRPALRVLMGAVALVLLIACANVANLLLARGEARHREMAVRLALGAGRGRILRQLLTESMVLALAGGAAGVLLAWWGMRTLLSVNPQAVPRMELIHIDGLVIAVTLAVSILTGLLFGIAPAMQLVKTQLQTSLKEGTRGGSVGGAQQRMGRALVMGEIALAFVVVIGAALLIRSFWTLRNVDPGFDPTHVLAVDLSIPPSRYNDVATIAFYKELVDRMGRLPGVRAAAAASDLPPSAGGFNWDMLIDGRTRAPGEAWPSPQVRAVTKDYFKALSIPAVRGRLFGDEDSPSSMPVAVINETTARSVWRGSDPIGQRVRFDRQLPWITIVGIARDVRSMGLGNPAPMELFLVNEQMPVAAGGAIRDMYAVLRTEGEPTSLVSAARRTVSELDPLLAIIAIRGMDEMMDIAVAQPRFTMLLLGMFGTVALTLAAIGIYGIMSYAVKRRTREIGIRMALGARSSDVLRLVVGQGMRLAIVGVTVGVISALVGTRLMTKLLYGVSATDPVTFASIVAILAVVAWVANWVPARRAVLTDPTTALRSE